MAVKLGIDPEKIGQVVNSGTGCSYASEFFIPRILDKGAMIRVFEDLLDV